MKKYQAGSIKNVCFVSHGGVGKTSLLEAVSFTSKSTSRLGKVAAGNSTFDSRADEKNHKMTISTHLGFCEWNDTKINILDTPGFLDFLGEAKAALRVVESTVILVDAVSGIQVGTELVSKYVEESGVPKLYYVNGCDKENADFVKVVQALKDNYGSGIAPIVVPIGSGTGFKGIVDLLKKEAWEYTRDGSGVGTKTTIPSSLEKDVATLRQALMETIAETDEALMNSYFEHGELTDEQIVKGLASGVKAGVLSPVIAGSSLYNMGSDKFLDALIELCPSADSRTEITVLEDSGEKSIKCTESSPAFSFVFKTISEEHLGEINLVRMFSGKIVSGQDVANVGRNSTERVGNMYFLKGKERVDTSELTFGDIGGLLKLKDTHTNDTLADKTIKYRFPPTILPEPLVKIAIAPKNKGDEDKVAVGLTKLNEEDTGFTYRYHADIHQSVLSAMGDMHLEVILEDLKNRFRVEVERTQTKISYRETITKPVRYVEYTHKKQSGGAGQYARVFIDLDPLPRGGGYEFLDKIVGGVIDQSLRPSVDKGVHSKLEEGILAGYPIVDVRVSLVDGKTHPVDSKDIAFQIAGREVFKKAFEMSSPILLEPVVDLEVTVPEEYTGDIMGDLSSRRGKIGGMTPSGKMQTISAKVPEVEVATYSSALRSLTQGRGFYTKKFSHYEPVPGELARKIIDTHAAVAQAVHE
ncbi:MAG: elongation factor G [Fibrobacter sp.]|nr:elongation factor G [Fibrobacter sp.]